jgi:hypothetical protein
MGWPSSGRSLDADVEHYFVSAILWFWFGMRTGDKNIYLPCIGWILLDSAVIVGVIIYG